MSEWEKGRGTGEQESRGDPAPLLPFSLSTLRPVFPLFAALAAMWLYRHAPSLAYFNDDPTGHFAWMEGQSLLRFFAGSADYGYYRPVVFAVLRLSELLFGNATFPHNPVADHALLLLLHGANTALVWVLARRWGGGDAFGWVVALVFAFVPFSYEAVAYVASLTHPLVVLWTLAALLLYDRSVETAGGRPPTTASSFVARHLSLVVLVLGLLTHENGLFIFPALVGQDWVTRPGATWRARARRLWPFAVPTVLFAALWLFIPKSSEQGLNSLADIGGNAIPLLQSLVYPLLPLFRFDAGDTLSLVLLAAAAVVILGLLVWWAGAWRVWVFALGWFALSSLPALLFLTPAYIYGSPRLSYLPSIGVALLWGLPVLWLWSRNRGGRKAVRAEKLGFCGVTGVYALAILLPPLPFIRCQLDFYEATSLFARQMAAAGATAPAGRDVVFVNAPFFFSSMPARPAGCPSPYPWTPVGGVLIPPYAQARDFVRFNGGPDRAVTGVTFAGYGPGWRTFGPEIDEVALRKHAAEDATYVFDLASGSFADLPAAWQPGAGRVGNPRALFGDVLALTDVVMRAGDDSLSIRLAWRVIAAVDAPLAAFVHVYDANGGLAAQSDGPPGQGLAPQVLWQAGDGLSDERLIDVSSLPPGVYSVGVGIYNAADGVRLTAKTDDRNLADDILPLGRIEK